MGSSSSVPSYSASFSNSATTGSPPPSPPSSPSRFNGKSNGEERPRFFDAKAKSKCWANADIVPGRHPERWRKDAAGNVVCKRFGNCSGCLCFEYDHIVPYSKGGESTAENCQILQTRVNRLKSAQENVDATTLKEYSCGLQFTDKELDVIEMAVYGDVLRPGKECRCKTVAELLGQSKSKDAKAACELPS
uniref:HNH domain-containing protein n=2 Tax=Noccaea caerulescens TaxID=107243 RepID=A0A1J3GKE7_NOCCA